MKIIKLLFLLLIVLSSQLSVGQSIVQLGSNYFVAGILSEEFKVYSAPEKEGKQRQSNWCWAACTQMVLNYHGLYVSQEQIVQRVYGNLVDQPANKQQITYALSGWAPNYYGRISHVFCESSITNVNEITSNLAYKWPLIVGLINPNNDIGHAYVLTAIYYSIDMYNNTIPHKVVLRDPMPGMLSKQEMSWGEFSNRVMMAFKVWVTR